MAGLGGQCFPRSLSSLDPLAGWLASEVWVIGRSSLLLLRLLLAAAAAAAHRRRRGAPRAWAAAAECDRDRGGNFYPGPTEVSVHGRWRVCSSILFYFIHRRRRRRLILLLLGGRRRGQALAWNPATAADRFPRDMTQDEDERLEHVRPEEPGPHPADWHRLWL
ncbi:hypothetical protein GGR56DRAFT_623623 [Xylariaceae sp. FL0804]|nr:hypothetical protein GGR56DRAFT_623623 [Xylariaceae sp. FL0804]